MATFPALEPATRKYTFGTFPLTEEPSPSAGIIRFRHGTIPAAYQLTLGYIYLTDAEASLIRTHYGMQAGSFLPFQLPPIIWKGHTFTGNVFPSTTSWCYADAPEETHHEIGRYSMTISLVSDGAYEYASPDPITATLVAGTATGA